MYNTQTRVNLVLQRAIVQEKRRRNGLIIKLSLLSYLLCALDIAMVFYISAPKRYHSPEDWMYGAMLLPSDAGGYVLVAIITFVVAAAVTVLCMKKQEKIEQEEEKS